MNFQDVILLTFQFLENSNLCILILTVEQLSKYFFDWLIF